MGNQPLVCHSGRRKSSITIDKLLQRACSGDILLIRDVQWCSGLGGIQLDPMVLRGIATAQEGKSFSIQKRVLPRKYALMQKCNVERLLCRRLDAGGAPHSSPESGSGS